MISKMGQNMLFLISSSIILSVMTLRKICLRCSERGFWDIVKADKIDQLTVFKTQRCGLNYAKLDLPLFLALMVAHIR